jgi:antagonist of KipI
MWQTVDVDVGDVLDIGAARRGTRAYLAVAGGFAIEPTLGSASTDVNARLGGLDGRPLRDGDTLVVGSYSPPDRRAAALAPDARGAAPTARQRSTRSKGSHPTWSLDPRPWFDADASHPIRLVRGSHFDALDAASRAALFDAVFRIDKDSNRVGFRLDGPHLALAAPLELVSEPLAIGTLQLPPGGAPIALMAEHPTVGGYPRIGQIAAIDLPRLAQRRPGDIVRFAPIDLETAQTRYLERERELERLIGAIGERLTR